MKTKKQIKALELAEAFILDLPEELKSREWQNLWEDGENNANALLIGLMDMIDEKPGFYKEVLANKQYMPEKLVNYAHFKAGAEKAEKRLDDISEAIENALNKIDNIIKYSQPFDTITPDKWDSIYRYELKALERFI